MSRDRQTTEAFPLKQEEQKAARVLDHSILPWSLKPCMNTIQNLQQHYKPYEEIFMQTSEITDNSSMV